MKKKIVILTTLLIVVLLVNGFNVLTTSALGEEPYVVQDAPANMFIKISVPEVVYAYTPAIEKWGCQEITLIMNLIAPVIQFSEGYAQDKVQREIPAIDINNIDDEMVGAGKRMVCNYPEHFTRSYMCTWVADNLYKGHIVGGEGNKLAAEQFWGYVSRIIGDPQKNSYCAEFNSLTSSFNETRWLKNVKY